MNMEVNDILYKEAKDLLREHQTASASFFQRKLRIGYNLAGAIIDRLETDGIVGPFNGARLRTIDMSKL